MIREHDWLGFKICLTKTKAVIWLSSKICLAKTKAIPILNFLSRFCQLEFGMPLFWLAIILAEQILRPNPLVT